MSPSRNSAAGTSCHCVLSFPASRLATAWVWVRRRLAACASPFGDRLGEIGEQHGEPQPQTDLAGKPCAGPEQQVAHEEDRRRGRHDLHREHDRVAPHVARVEFPEGVADRRPQDSGVEQRAGLRGHR
jgi:hypothetical protein